VADLTIKEAITEQLDHMPLELQRRVLDFAQTLAQSRPRGEPGKELLRFAGLLDAETAQSMMESIEAGCERIDVNEW
jgi:hypothetical protein